MTISKEQALSAVLQLRNLVPSIAAGAQAQEACNTLRTFINQAADLAAHRKGE